MPREHTGHSKHPLLTTPEMTLCMDITRCSILKSNWLCSLSGKAGEALYSQQKQDWELTVAQIMNSLQNKNLNWNLGKITSSFRYDLNQIPYDYTVQFSHSVVFDSLRPHELHHARPPCPSQIPRAYPKKCPLSWWCHPTISSSVISFSCPQSSPASGSFQMSQLFAWGGQSIGVSASTSVLPMNTQDWSLLVGSPCSHRDSQESSLTLQFKSIYSLALSFLYSSTLTSIHDDWENHSFE